MPDTAARILLRLCEMKVKPMREPAQSLPEALLQCIRPAVRRERAYHVGAAPDVTVKLNQNESPYDLPPPLKQELVTAFMEVAFNRYPTEQPHALLEALAPHTGHDPAGILVGNGSNELTHVLGLSFISSGTPVVVPRPMFALYESVIRLFDGQVVAVPPRADLRFDTEAICAAMAEHRPALTIITTPNNPTGLAMPFEEVARIVVEAPGFVLVDEAYVEFSDQPSAQQLLATHPQLILLRTLSKAFGLAGLRVGYLMAQPAVVQELLKGRLPFMIDRLAEATALALLRRPALLQERVGEMQAQCQALSTALAAIEEVEVVPSTTNFVLFRTPADPSVLLERLAAAGVLVRNMKGYPELQGFLRVNAGTPAENKVFLTALKGALQTEQAM